jgi:hypothetical protein
MDLDPGEERLIFQIVVNYYAVRFSNFSRRMIRFQFQVGMILTSFLSSLLLVLYLMNKDILWVVFWAWLVGLLILEVSRRWIMKKARGMRDSERVERALREIRNITALDRDRQLLIRLISNLRDKHSQTIDDIVTEAMRSPTLSQLTFIRDLAKTIGV